MEREKIIALIVEDIKHNQLLNGLNSIGLNDDNRFVLKLDRVVADLMGFTKIPDKWFDCYHKTILNITSEYTADELQEQAVILYSTLQSIHR